MTAWFFFVGSGVLAAFLAGKSWLRWGNPDRRKLRRRWNQSTRDEKWNWWERNQQFEQWVQLNSPDERPLGVRFFDGLDLIVGLTCFLAVAAGLGMFGGGSTHNGNGTVIANNLLGFALWGVKFVVLLVVVMVPVYLLLRRIENAPLKTLAYIVVVGFAGMMWASAHKSAPVASTKPSVTTPAQSGPVQPVVEKPEDRTVLVARLQALEAQARIRWRADVDAAGAKGPPGLVPPMLEIREETPGQWRVTNRSERSVCVSIARVARSAKGVTNYDHCPSDIAVGCREIARRGSRQFVFHRNERSRACIAATFEFRVGTPQKPEPTWWSDSALEEFDRDVSEPPQYAEFDILHLRGEIAVVEAMLAERDRASRWRRELASIAPNISVGRAREK
jgi:hypothetical protein